MKVQQGPVGEFEIIPIDLSPLQTVVACFERIAAIEDEAVRTEALKAVKWITHPVGVYRQEGGE